MKPATRFTTDDWCSFSGAEPFSDGSEPFITQRTAYNDGHHECVIIASQGSIDVYITDVWDEEDRQQWYRLEVPLSAAASEAVLNALPEVIDEDVLASFGFVFVSII